MIQRERPGPENGSLAAAANSPGFAAPFSPLLLTHSASLWEQWYEQSFPDQRQQVLARAGEQGLLFSHQLPAAENRPAAGPRRSLLTALLHGPAPELEPIRIGTLQPIDGDLDETQRQAVASALATPDVAMLLGYPGSGKSRVVAEVLRQSVQAGQRVLFLAPAPAALDCVLSRLAGEPNLGVIRRLSNNETPESLSACLGPLTLEQRVRTFAEQTLPAARQAAETSAAALEQLRRREPAWDTFSECLAQNESLQARIRDIQEQRAGLSAALEAELAGNADSPFRSALDEAQRIPQEAVALADAHLEEIRAETAKLTAEQAQRDAERQELAPLADAKQGHRWWTSAFWRATLQGGRLQRLEELQSASQQAEQRMQALQALEKEQLSVRASKLDELAEQRKALVEAEQARRDQSLADQLAELLRQRELATETWQALVQPWKGAAAVSSPCETVQAVRDAWSAECTAAEQELRLREQWLEALQKTQPTLIAQLAPSARIVATTISALPADSLFGDRGTAGPFDLVVIEEAHRLSDAELLAVSRRGRRWLLVGEMPADLPAPPAPPRRGGPIRPRPVQPRPAFQRLWNLLHPDPRRLQTRWRIAGDRLIGSLRPIAPEQEAWVQHEPVFDRPEITLCIVAPPRQDPQIAEVLFPAATPVEDAKEFIYRELQELSVQSSGPSLRWRECERCVTLELGAGSDPSSVAVGLEVGVRELVHLSPCATEGEAPWQTCALAFDRADGWDRTRAERWLSEHLGLRDSGRTTVLARSYRMRGPLGRFLFDLLYAGQLGGSAEAGAAPLFPASPAVAFVPVPSRKDDKRQEPALDSSFTLHPSSQGGTATLTSRVRAVKGGAGLEIDLSDTRRAESLPGELRSALPRQGVVNLAEARAVVAALEAMAGDPSFAPACAATAATTGPAVAVISLFPAQVELLRLLIQRSSILTRSPIRLEVGLPAAFHQREALVVLLSLVRSHLSRAVPFSDSPQSLLLALTRPMARLVLFGDPGTMARRSQWHGGLDHLDEAAGPMEQALIAQLLGYFAEPDASARTGRSRESSGV